MQGIEDDYGVWYANYNPEYQDVAVFTNKRLADRETEAFGGRTLEIRTYPAACISVEEWKRDIARQVRNVLESDPKHKGPIDLRYSSSNWAMTPAPVGVTETPTP
jgi:hypothetical protein